MAFIQYVETASFQPKVSTELLSSGWKLKSLSGVNTDTLHNPELDRYLASGGSLRFQMVGDAFEDGDPALIKAVVDTALSKGKSVFNSPKIRVSGDPTVGEVLQLQPTDYFQGLATNEIALKTAILDNGHSINGTELAFPDNTITSLAVSKLSNHIGACALAFDANGVLSLVKTGKASMVSAQKIAPSAAGSADVEDFHRGTDDLAECIIAGLKRELIEEQGISMADISVARLIGFQRYIPRGAKPEFVGFIRLGDTWANCRKGISADESVFTDGHIDLDCVSMGVDGLRAWLQENESTISFSTKQCFWSLFNIAQTDVELNTLISA